MPSKNMGLFLYDVEPNYLLMTGESSIGDRLKDRVGIAGANQEYVNGFFRDMTLA